MLTFWNADNRTDICRRVGCLTTEHHPLWGKMNVGQMLAHLNDALRMAAGDLATTPKKTPLGRWPLKQLVIYVLPWPHNVPTAPELVARIDDADFAREQQEFIRIAQRLSARRANDRWPVHPAFGPMTYRAWGVLVYRHADHHLKQFGV